MPMRGFDTGSSSSQQQSPTETPSRTTSPPSTSSHLNNLKLQTGGNDAGSSTAAPSTGLTRLSVNSSGVLVPLGVVPKACTRTFKKVKNHTGYNWKLTPEHVKQIYWEEFKKIFTWDPSIESIVHDKWKSKAGRRYRDYVNKIKTKKDLPGHNPLPYIDENAWPNWLSYWNSKEVQAKSAIAKNCRMSEPAGPGTGIVKHKGGSRSALQYAEDLALKRGVQVKDCLYEAYSILHKKKDGTFTDEKSAGIEREVLERAQQLSQPLPGTTEPQEVDINKIYMDIVGMSEKNTIFGGGEIAEVIRSHNSTSTTGTSQFHSQEACDSRFTSMQERLESLTSLVETQQQMLERVLAQGGSSTNPSSSPSDNG